MKKCSGFYYKYNYDIKKSEKVEFTNGKFHTFGIDWEEIGEGVGLFTTAVIELQDGTMLNVPVINIRFTSQEDIITSDCFTIETGDVEIFSKLVRSYSVEKKGKLLELPCTVGDKIYRIDTDENIEHREIEIYDIDNIVICSDGKILLKYDAYDGVICHLENIITNKPYLDYYRCFLVQEQAEAAFKEISEQRERIGKYEVNS